MSVCHRLSCEKFPQKPCLGRRTVTNGVAGPYEFISFQQAAEQSVQIASACKALGLKAKDKVGVLGLNSPEWMLAMQVGLLCWCCLM